MSRIDVPNVRLLEEVTWHQREARRAAGTVYTPARRRIVGETKRRWCDVAADISSHPLSGEGIQNRRKGPAIEDVLGRSIVERIRTIDHTRDKLLPTIEVRKRIFA